MSAPRDEKLQMDDHAAQPHQRLRRALMAMLLIIGSAVALLLAHSYEVEHASPGATAPMTVEVAHVDSDTAVASVVTVGPAFDEGFLTDSAALCLSIGVGCVIALLFTLLALRRPPVTRASTAKPVQRKLTALALSTWIPRATVTTLCTIRI